MERWCVLATHCHKREILTPAYRAGIFLRLVEWAYSRSHWVISQLIHYILRKGTKVWQYKNMQKCYYVFVHFKCGWPHIGHILFEVVWLFSFCFRDNGIHGIWLTKECIFWKWDSGGGGDLKTSVFAHARACVSCKLQFLFNKEMLQCGWSIFRNYQLFGGLLAFSVSSIC